MKPRTFPLTMTIDGLWAIQDRAKAHQKRAAALRESVETMLEAIRKGLTISPLQVGEEALAADDRRLKRMRAGR